MKKKDEMIYSEKWARMQRKQNGRGKTHFRKLYSNRAEEKGIEL